MGRLIQGACAAVMVAAVAGACGGSTVVDPGGAGTGGNGTGASGAAGNGTGAGTAGSGALCSLGTVGRQPPPPAANPDDPISGTVQLVVQELWLGNKDWNGNASSSAWKIFGYNLDDQITDTSNLDTVCIPPAGGAPMSTHPDGDAGIDNGFGKKLMPLFTGLAPDIGEETNWAIADGGFSLLIEVAGLGPGADYEPLYGTAWRGARLHAAPAFDGSDLWPPLASSQGAFPCGYAADHQVVLAQGSLVEIPILFMDGPVPWVLKLHHGIITMQLASDHQTVTEGIIAGILDLQELSDDFTTVAGYFDPSLCPPSSTTEQILDQFRQVADIMADGSQDPAQMCTGISIGLGFRGTLVTLGDPEADPPPPPDPCGPQPG